MPRIDRIIRWTIPGFMALAVCGVLLAGDLEPPPGTPGPTMKTLTEVEPRTIISSVPFTIDLPGSYYLTGDIDAMGSAGIRVDTDNVTIDLGGFTLSNGTGSGIYVTGSRVGLEIRNGRLKGWAGDGLRLYDPGNPTVDIARGSRVSGVYAIGNGGAGIRAGGATIVEDCLAIQNDLDGIQTLSTCIIRNSVARLNLQHGIEVLDGATILDSVASNNSMDGIVLENQGQVSRSSAYGNGGYGIRVYGGCIVTDNVSGQNSQSGIRIDHNGNRVTFNMLSANPSGITAPGGSTGNVIYGNVLNSSGSNGSLSGNTLTDEATAAAEAAEATAQTAAANAAGAETAAQTAATNAAGAQTAAVTAATNAGNAESAANTAATQAADAETAASAAETAALAAKDPRVPIHASDLPLTIPGPGSYYLAESVAWTTIDPAEPAIRVDADNVTIDLKGFTLDGTGSAGGGIKGNGTGLTVLSGSIRGWGGWGIDAGDETRLESVTVEANGGGGVRTGDESVILHAAVRSNGGDGIYAGDRSKIGDSSIANNMVRGIVVGASATVSRNDCSGNGVAGIHVSGSGGRIEENNVTYNGVGIRVAQGHNVIVRNTVIVTGTEQDFDIMGDNIFQVSTSLTGAGPWDNLSH
ncbi:MAG TPA: right-handed parallel beta-helix repeat-containing protein [Candidatus Saccharimonadales bacterium]|nr:right-handed parallel beta-helix repeat-containing protein [Candidatus Saccharimonadales bacterium]